jgi:putative transposase
MTLPRQILPGQFYMLTRGCTQRLFLLSPCKEMNNAYVYCLGEAVQRYDMEALLSQQMSNHHHPIVFDRYGRIAEFMAHLHKMLAKCVNAFRGRWENMWSSEPPCLVELVDRSDVIDKLVYVATNPVLDHLVEKVHHWPGAKLVHGLLSQEPITATRPDFFFADDGPMPESVTLRFTIPPELGETDEVLRQLRERIASVEAEQAQIRARTGRRIVGRGQIVKQSWRQSPETFEPRRNLRPRVAARSKWSRLEALRRNQEFVNAYRRARAAWLAGTPIPFPAGTYWLQRFVGVPVEPLQN